MANGENENMIITERERDQIEELLAIMPDDPTGDNRQLVATLHTNMLLALLCVRINSLLWRGRS